MRTSLVLPMEPPVVMPETLGFELETSSMTTGPLTLSEAFAPV